MVICDVAVRRHSLFDHTFSCVLVKIIKPLGLLACRRNFRDAAGVTAPVVHWEYCGPRILTLEYLPGAFRERVWAAFST